MRRRMLACLALPGLLRAGAGKVLLRPTRGHDHGLLAHGHAHNLGIPHAAGGGHHFSSHSGAYIHNGVLHRPPAAHRDAYAVPPAPGHEAPQAAAPHTGLPHNPYDHSTGHQYIPPAASPAGGLSGMGTGMGGGLSGMGMGMGGVMSVLPAVAAGTAVAHLAGHRASASAHPGAPGTAGEWQSTAICNAYASESPLTLVHWQGQFKMTSSPLLYKTCRAHDKTLQDGDKFAFHVGDAPIGTFNVTHAARRGIMVLVVTRDAQNASRAAFVSHTFRGHTPQAAALVDAYAGKGPGQQAKVLDGGTPLDFSQEVALRPGAHLVSLVDASDMNTTIGQVPVEVPSNLNAKYLFARVGYAGLASGGSGAFKPELVVLPLPLKPMVLPTTAGKQDKHSGATTGTRAAPLLILALAAMHVG